MGFRSSLFLRYGEIFTEDELPCEEEITCEEPPTCTLEPDEETEEIRPLS